MADRLAVAPGGGYRGTGDEYWDSRLGDVMTAVERFLAAVARPSAEQLC